MLHGLNLQTKKGSVVSVIGPNGAGKVDPAQRADGRAAFARRHRSTGAMGLKTLEERVMQGIALVPRRAPCSAPCRWKTTCCSAATAVLLGPTGNAEMLGQVYALFPRLKERRMQLAGTLSGGERQMLRSAAR